MLNSQLHKMRQSILEIPSSSLAALMGINPDRLSLYLNGTRQLSNVDIEKLDALFDDLTRLVECASPWPLQWRNVEIIKNLLKRMKDGEFDRQGTAQ
jgi:transcriptional regulator with XRE-family HTH domain